MKIASACLLGIKCDYRGESRPSQKLIEEYSHGNIYPVCPEVLGGLPIPRKPSEIIGGDGNDVLCGQAIVLDSEGSDVTENFISGAKITLDIALSIGAKEAILKSKSPSCGCGLIYDGSFSHKLRGGDGVACAFLKAYGIKIHTEEEYG